jgi:apolipoprotein N-acyltransferase
MAWWPFLAALLLGALAAAALPPLGLVPLLLLAVPGLLWLVARCARASEVFWLGFAFGFGHHLFGLYWITEAILIEAAQFWWFVPLAVPGLAAILALFIAVPVMLAWYAAPGWRRVVMLAAAWTLADLARQFVGGGFPWNPWASVWALPGEIGTVMLQPLALIGTPGVTGLTVLLAGLPALGRRGWIGLAAALLAWAGFGLWWRAAPEAAPPGFTAILVQGDIAEGQKWSAERALEIFRRHLDLTQEGVYQAGPGAKLVIWPETASPYPLLADAEARRAISEAAGGSPALVGSVRWGADGRPRNSLIALDGTGAVVGVYDKFHLVPGGEYQPEWLPLPVQIVPGGGFAPGKGPRTLTLPGLPAVGPLICYEAIYPHQVADERARPGVLVNVTNDAWFGDSSGPRQHLAAARMRAIEEGLPLLRAANTGISAAFDGHGRELARLGLDRQGVVTIPVPGELPPPPFAQLGLFLPFMLALVAAMVTFSWKNSFLKTKNHTMI